MIYPILILETIDVLPRNSKISQAGDYSFILTCYGKPNDIATDEIFVKVYNLPFWHEIIPVLPGFLKGLFRK